MIANAHARLVAKLSYTNIGFALAPREFVLSTLRDVYGAALGYQVDATNLQRVLVRRGVITPTGTTAKSGRAAAGPPRSTASPSRSTGSPTSSPPCARRRDTAPRCWSLRDR